MIAADLGEGPTLVSAPENGEFGNTTFFVTSEDAQSRLRTYMGTAPCAAFALMTDGAAESLFHRRSAGVAPAVSVLFQWCREEKPALFRRALNANLKDVIAPRTTDDAGLAVIAA